jgi:hypothetical protein
MFVFVLRATNINTFRMDSVNIKEINDKIKDESAFIDLLTMEVNKVIIGQGPMID